MNTTHTLVENYFEMWNEPDASTRRDIIEKLWTQDAMSVDPVAAAKGHEEIAAMVTGVQTSYPGHRFNLTGEITEHHDRLHFRWEMKDADEKVQLAGLDSVRLAENQFADLAGFWV